MDKSAAGIYSGFYFDSAEAAALHFQYLARLRSANSREFGRYGPMRCAWMQRQASALYAAARAALGGKEARPCGDGCRGCDFCALPSNAPDESAA